MDVRMMPCCLAPGVEDHSDSELCAEMLGIGGNGGQRLGRRVEQDRVDKGLVLEGDLADRRRQREDDMEVRHRQQQLRPAAPRAIGPAPAPGIWDK